MTTGTSADDRRGAWLVGVLVMVVAFVLYALSSYQFDAGRPDFFYLADAFLHGRLYLDRALGPWDNVVVDGRVYVPFAPFPAIAFAPIVAVFGPARLDQWEQIVDSAIAAADVGLCWWLMARLGVRSLLDRL
ncbi:MAG TPA: hypothetical protein VLR93_10365, partial [Patescibacteria group bacterium]|nr:hypothetical protein [Patescibacteria group bacterium]